MGAGASHRSGSLTAEHGLWRAQAPVVAALGSVVVKNGY